MDIRNKFMIILLAALGASGQVSAGMTKPDTVFVTDFGAVPDSRKNAVEAVRAALEACRDTDGAVLYFPEGRYDFWPQHCTEKEYFESNTTDINPKRLAVFIENRKNLTVDCGGSEFVFHDRMQPFTVDGSTGITIKNVSVDWDIPLTAEAEVAEVTDEYVDILIDPCESPYIIEDGKLVFVGEGWKSRWSGVMEFDRETLLIAPGTGDDPCLGRSWNRYTATDLGDGRVRLNYPFARKPGKGNYLVLRHSERDHAGIFITGSDDVRLENLNIYHTAGLGVLAQFSGNLSYSNVNVVPNEAKKRILSGHDDGFHFSNCRGEIRISNCEFAALMDDPVNVHGTSVRVEELVSPVKVTCRFMHHQSVGMEWGHPGDSIGFIENKSMQTFATGKLISFEKIDNELFTLTFEAPLPQQLKTGDALENLTWTPSVLIGNSRFKSCRARGILVSTPRKVIIMNNTFESSGSAILIAGDANNWYESGAVSDVLITGNRFLDPCMSSMYQFSEAIISIYPEIPELAKGKYFHRNIRIENNEFHPFDYPVLWARSVSGLTFSGNSIIRSNIYQPFHSNKAGLTFDHCTGVKVAGNIFHGDVLGKDVSLSGMKNSEITVDRNDAWSSGR